MSPVLPPCCSSALLSELQSLTWRAFEWSCWAGWWVPVLTEYHMHQSKERAGLGSQHNVMFRVYSGSWLGNTEKYILGFSRGSLPKALTVFKLQLKKFRFQSRAPGQRTDLCPSGYCFMIDSEKDFKHENLQTKNVDGPET